MLAAIVAAVSLLVTGAEPSSDQVKTQTFTQHSRPLDRDLEQILLVPDAAAPELSRRLPPAARP